MKKSVIILILAIGFTCQSQAQTDTTKMNNKNTTKTSPGATKYFYYPEANIYQNEATGTYSYFDVATSTWVTNPQLPSSYSVNKNSSKTEITYNGADVWTDNVAHQKKYSKTNKMAPKQ